MLTRILAVALAVGSLACASAYAQTSTPGTTSPSTTTPGTTSPSTTSPGTTSPSTGATSGSSGSMGQQAQQPMGTFDASKYKTKTECLNAATAAHASASLCNNLK